MLHTKFIPAQPADSKRLMIVLHGLGDSATGYHWLPAALQLPWLNYLLVNAPDEYYGGYSWFDIHDRSEAGVERSRRLLEELIETQRQGGFPTDQTILFGFSQGCLMTLETGLRHPHRFAGLIGISGYVLDPDRLIEELAPVARQQKVLVTHGTHDPLIPCAAARLQMKQLQAAGLAITWHEVAKVHTIDEAAELPLIRQFILGAYGEPG